MNLADAVTLHQLALQAEGRSPQTGQLYLIYQRRFLEYLDEQRIRPTLDALSTANVRTAVEWFRSQHGDGSRGGQVAAATLVTTLKTWASFLAAEGVYEGGSPLQRLRRVKVSKKLRQPFTQTELVALWGACRLSRSPARDEALFLLLLDTGLRIGEATTITLDRLQLDEHRIIVGLDGKGRREHVVPIGDLTKRDGGRTIRALRQYVLRHRQRESERSGNRLFLTPGGYPLTAEGGSDIIKRLGRAAGVENCHPHRLRHTFATWYLTVHPGDELGLRRIIGHASREVTADYVHLAQTTIAQRAGRASLAETMGNPPGVVVPVAIRRAQPIGATWGATPRVSDEEPRPPQQPARRASRSDELLDLVRSDPALRKELLRALLGESQYEAPVPTQDAGASQGP